MNAGFSSNVEHFDRIFVGRLPAGTTEEELRAAFAISGSSVGWIKVVRNRATGLPRGFAFVSLLAPFDAALDPRALDRLASTTMDGHSLDIRGVPETT
jgi:hypothetical protein